MADKNLNSTAGEILYGESQTKFLDKKKCGTEDLKAELARMHKKLIAFHEELKKEIQHRIRIEKDLMERLRFETIVSELSARFVRISNDRVDAEIQNALKRILEFFMVDRCALVKIAHNKTNWQITHLESADGMPDLPVQIDLPSALFPWFFDKMVIKREAHGFASLQEFPPQALIDKQTYAEWGIKSILNIPIDVDGASEYVLSISSDSCERSWPEEYFPRLQTLGEILVKALKLLKTQRRLLNRQKFEKLVADISAGFVTGSSGDFDNAINKWLCKIADFFNADKSILRLLSMDGNSLGSVFEYCRKGFKPSPASMSRNNLPWYVARLAQGEPMVIETLDDFPEEAKNERQFCESENIKSVLSVPMVSGGKVLGVCALISIRAERGWPKDLVQRMRFVADVFAGAIARKNMDEQLSEKLIEIEQLKTQLEEENIHLRKEIELHQINKEIIGHSSAIKTLLAKIEKVAKTNSTVLIEGETGSGKELTARAIHQLSARKNRSLITVNCASLPPTLIESELFGREKGAYTGAMTQMTGRFEMADGGTLFLDEIGEIPHEVQAKLLRVIEEGKFERLGSNRTLKVDVRIIAATNRKLSQEMAEGNFRKDLYYRLNVFPIVIPPLRERTEDIPMLVWAFVRRFENKMGKRFDSISKKCMENLIHYSWPGNVRELKNIVERSMILCKGKKLEMRLPKEAFFEKPTIMSLKDIERDHILSVLRNTDWRISGKGSAGELLGLKRTTLQSKMKKLDIRKPSK